MGMLGTTGQTRTGRVRSYESRVRVRFSLILFPVGVAGMILLVALLQVGAAHGRLADELELELESLATLRSDLAHAGPLVEGYATTGSTRFKTQLEILTRSVEGNLELVSGFDDPEEVRLGAAATAAWEAGRREMSRVLAAAPGEASAIAAVAQFDEAEEQIARLDHVSRDELRATAEASARTSRLVVGVALLIGACATALNVVLVQRLLNATFRPLRHLTVGVGRFSADDLAHRIEPVGDREFQAVGDSFNAMADRLEDTFASLEHQAFHDALTGLPNRAGLLRHLQSDQAGERSIALFDIDDFKAVNDGLGHVAGDDALAQVAQRLSQAMRPGDFLARLGGDEFVVVLEGLSVVGAGAIAERIADAIACPVEVSGRSVVLHASGGIASVQPGDDPVDVLRTADVALYVAKEAGKQCVRLFSPDMLSDVEAHLQMATDLRGALARGEITVHYQPTVFTDSGTVHGVEALMRWTHPLHGKVPPSTFIPVAEETGEILALGRHVLETACAQAKAWQQLPGLAHLTVNVNMSASQLHAPDIAADVGRALDRSCLAPESLVIEVTESVMADPEAVSRVHEIKALGVLIALDDFGTGYSSLSYLQRLPIDVLKIDKSFIDDIDRRADRAVLASTIVRLGRALGLLTVAEGVERSDQMRTLESVGCDLVQGYLFSRPLPADEAEERLLALTGPSVAAPQSRGGHSVRVSVGPLDAAAAREWLSHAHLVLDELESGGLAPAAVSPAVISLMRDYVLRWTVAAMDSDAFVWIVDEDAELLGLMMSRWRDVSGVLVDDARRGTLLISPAAAAFSEALVHSILVSLATHRDSHQPIPAAALAQRWPNRSADARRTAAPTTDARTTDAGTT